VKRIAIIPARSGSKRIPGKNLKEFFGEPIITYAIKNALESGLFDKVMVSTDSDEIKKIALKCGAEVPFLRSEKNSDDTATTANVLGEVLLNYEKSGEIFDTACCIYPTSVLITTEKLKEGAIQLEKGNFDSVVSVIKYGHPIQRGFKASNNKIEMLWPENRTKRSQDLETVYHDAGQFYFFKVAEFINNKQLFTENTGFVLLSEYEAQDIDNPDDWKMAEIKFTYLNGSNKKA
jgi:pseudaminic acid cytidylyltransferase